MLHQYIPTRKSRRQGLRLDGSRCVISVCSTPSAVFEHVYRKDSKACLPCPLDDAQQGGAQAALRKCLNGVRGVKAGHAQAELPPSCLNLQ